ncbi:fumarylacetoacetate hydrolase family protein [Aestuariispira ectoiniformans]|uniref:fumarylacetoacetate hydrolase family protein n=1 Tax=Aestuariispira ectoiniformans TaxID=2775080 RepID=UPI00223B4359|nr:fumarylacetoacetate hydrolase family protein [Aestuariispira ectoiniformans]
MQYVFPPMPSVTVPTTGNQDFPVHRVYCVGRNYADHAIEMGHDPDREPPFFFTKPADAIVQDGATIPYPKATADLHHEVELVIALGSGGSDIPLEQAADHIFGYAVGIDLTRRDLQKTAKDLSRPWDTAKAFDQSAPCGAIRPASEIGHPDTGHISLTINGETRQQGDIAAMIWKGPEIVAYLSTLFELQAGDLIFTGTPAGVGPVNRGDQLHAELDRVGSLDLTIA